MNPTAASLVEPETEPETEPELAPARGSGPLPGSVCALPPVWKRFLGYLSADGLTYLLGFPIYGWLIRILADRQYGQLSVATGIYQVLMVLAALGLDLDGPRHIAEAGGDAIRIVRRGQWIRLSVALGVCAPATAGLAIVYWQRGQATVAAVIVGGFAMVLARALDVSYLAVALGMPGALARTRTLGLGLYLALLILSKPLVVQMLWIVPVLNAIGVTAGRMELFRILRQRSRVVAAVPRLAAGIRAMAWQGAKTGSGLLLLLAYQTLDVVLLARYVPPAAVGQYAITSRLYLLGTAVLGCLLNTFLPELVAAAGERKLLPQRFQRFFLYSACLGVIGAAVFWTAGAWACEILAHRHLAITRQVTPFYALLFLVMAICNPFLSLLPTFRRGGAYAVGIASAALLLSAADVILIPRLGAVGAAVGQLIATSFLTVFAAGVFARYVRGLGPEGGLAFPSGAVSRAATP
jgi:O-antigen/teichoic acid export membrane protein